MADPANTPSTDFSAAIVAEHLGSSLKDQDTTNPRDWRDSINLKIPPTPPSSLQSPSYLNESEENLPLNRRPLFSSMREALESSGQVKEEPGGYVIKRHSGHQQFRSTDTGKSKYRHSKRISKDNSSVITTPEDEADAAGYTVIRRSSCDESNLSTCSHAQARRNPRKKTQQQLRPRRSSISGLHSSSLVASMTPPSSVPPGFQPRPASRVLRPPPGLTPAASGWVVKAAAPAETANKIEEPPVEALWPDMKSTAKTDSWTVGTSESLQAQAWSSSQTENENDDDADDLLARLGVTLN
ncbi:hypothetical protein PHMEG_00011911 [Phytophthora megakarya]|uniref:Uncharacterized protein n=1 Tax=Phytophthora megakarya TaxID=4795 RepID=A0A225WCM7_9STRA|nr:hypothetical protein PHMEG_00011911 [Phytophthora megakarya]